MKHLVDVKKLKKYFIKKELILTIFVVSKKYKTIYQKTRNSNNLSKSFLYL